MPTKERTISSDPFLGRAGRLFSKNVFVIFRLKLLRADVSAELLPAGCSAADLLPAVNVKEKIEVNGE